jgi:acyl-CoA reductase-like NAD-dependent aldehyde dehydrogenase
MTMEAGRLSDHYGQVYLDGAWVSPASSATIAVINPASEQVIAEVPAGSPEDADRAVGAAVRSFGSWAQVPPVERGMYLRLAANLLRERSAEIADLISAEVGTPRKVAVRAQVQNALDTLTEHADLAGEYLWEETVRGTRVVRAPVGVVAAVTPWNFPLGLAVDKVAPALLAGCPVVLKPSELAPLSAWALAEAFDAVGLPPGVFNLVSGTGEAVGEPLVRHPGVDMISFTGSTGTGERIAALAAERAARVVLEMGGKSASIVLDDADLDAAVPASVQSCFSNNGQVCVAWSRLLAPRHMHDEIVDRVRAVVEKVEVGDPATDAQLGPLVSAAQRATVRRYIEQAVDEGATLVIGGAEPPEGLPTGYYVRPTVFADVNNSMTIAMEEVFGPVLSIIDYDDEQDAVKIANESRYGLSGAVWSRDTGRAGQVARRLRTGTVRVNGAPVSRSAPFGGFKESGLGRARGRFGLAEYTELQAIAGIDG